MSFFGKNIKKIRKVKRLSQQKFAELFDLKRATLGAYEEERSEPKIDTLIKIANYFSIAIDDLLISELTVNKLLQYKGDVVLDEETTQKKTLTSIPYITKEHQQSYISYYTKKTFINDLPKLSLPLEKTKKLRGYEISNLEMSSTNGGLEPKDIVIGEYLSKEFYNKIENNSLVLVLTNDNLIFREIEVDNTNITLKSKHSSITDIEIKTDTIKELWLVKYIFYSRIPTLNNSIENKIDFLTRELIAIKEKM